MPLTRKCPHCGGVVVSTARQCACGYDFVAHTPLPQQANRRNGALMLLVGWWLIFFGRGWPSQTAFTCDRRALPEGQCQLVIIRPLWGATTRTIPLPQIQGAWLHRSYDLESGYSWEYVYLQTSTGKIELGDIYQLDQVRAFLADPMTPQLELAAANSLFDFVFGPGLGFLVFILGLWLVIAR